jgi:phosphate transport system substrate-binding protein
VKIILSLPGLFFILFFSGCNHSSREQREHDSKIITISGAFALYPLTVKWAEEFRKIHPQIRIDVSAGGAGKGMTDALSKVVDIGLVSRELHPAETERGAWPIAVAKDAVVPIVSAANPGLEKIMKDGLTKEMLADIFITGTITSWSQMNTGNTHPIHVYTRSDAAGGAASWAKFFDKNQEDLRGVGVFGDPGLAQAVIKDPDGIGYNNVVYAFDPETKKQIAGLRIIPVDFNGNGRIDPEENFYESIDDLIQAIGEQKFPSPPARDLFFVTNGKPQKKIVTEFIKWVLTDGQKYIHEAGYVNLPAEKIESELNKL